MSPQGGRRVLVLSSWSETVLSASDVSAALAAPNLDAHHRLGQAEAVSEQRAEKTSHDYVFSSSAAVT